MSFLDAGGGAILTFEWHPNPIVLATNFRRGADFLEDLVLPLTLSKVPAIASMNRRFSSKTDPGGGPWAPWSPTYKSKGSLGILTGETKGAATSFAAWVVTTNEMFFDMGAIPQQGVWFNDGTGAKHAVNKRLTEQHLANPGLFAEGSTFGDQPARPFAGIDSEAEFAILDIFDAWVGQAANIILFGSGPRMGQAAWVNPTTGRFMKSPV